MPLNESQLCPHWGECGGCQMQDVPYPEQVAHKETVLRELFAPFWDAPIPVTPSPVVWHYRNKVDPTFARMQYDEPPPKDFVRDSVLGFKKKGRWFWPLDIQDCLIGPEAMADLMAAMRVWMRDQGLHAFQFLNFTVVGLYQPV